MGLDGGVRLRRFLLLFVVLLLFAMVEARNNNKKGTHQHKARKDKVLLTDIQTLTFTKGKFTTGRRASPVPHLECEKGNACSLYIPEVVQCKNMGSDGIDVQWQCQAEMPSQYRFGSTEVYCEGYDHPDDPYVLKGSCGLVYGLYTDRQHQRHEGSNWRGDSEDYGHSWWGEQQHRNRQEWQRWMRTWNSFQFGPGFYFFLGVVTLICYNIFFCDRDHSRNTYYSDGLRGGATGRGNQDVGSRQTHSEGGNSSSNSGFWTGLGLGGLLGWAMGSGGTHRYHGDYGYDEYGHYHHGRDFYAPGGFGWGGRRNRFGQRFARSDFTQRSTNNGSRSIGGGHRSTRSSTGFGGTRRR